MACLACGCSCSGSPDQGTLTRSLVYVVDSTGQLASVDLATGIAYPIGTPATQFSDIAFDAKKNLWAVDRYTFYKIDPDAREIPIGQHSVPRANALAFGPDGTLYAAGSGSTWLYTIDMSTGAGTPLVDIGHICDGGLAWLDGKLVLSSKEQLVSVDPGNHWQATVLGTIGFQSVWGLSVTSDGELYGFAGQDIITIDPTTGGARRAWNMDGQGLKGFAGGSFADGAVQSGNP